MKETTGDIWSMQSDYIVVTTNGDWKKDGKAVMGRGIALEAKNRYHGIDERLGHLLRVFGNRVFIIDKIITFPTKHHWRNRKSDMALIEKSAIELSKLIRQETVLLPEPGCENGGLNWNDVKPILAKYLDDQFTVVHRY